MSARQPTHRGSVRDPIDPDVSHSSWPKDESRTGQVRRLLARAGIRPGQRVLHIGDHLPECDASQPEEFRLRAAHKSDGEDGTAPPAEVFDAVVALDCAPPTAISTTAQVWRRVIEPESGAVVVTGTDIAVAEGAGEPVSRQWAEELEAAGFVIERMARFPVERGHYGALAETARLVQDSLHTALGAGPARSYLALIRRLEESVRREAAHRFEIIARSPGVT